ncbi:MAG: CBS domain-containing protein [Pseudomonadota bacterium]
MRARDVMTTDVVTVRKENTLMEAINLLVNANVTALPVVDEGGALVGLLSEYDLIRQVLPGSTEAYARPVGAAMTTPVVTLGEDSAFEDIAAVIVESRYRLIPIVRGERIVGVVGRNDLVKALLSRAPEGPPAEPGAISDEDLRRGVIAAMTRSGIAVGGGFDVVARRGVVHLWGEVSDEADHQACRAEAMKVPGVRDVLNHMQIISPARRMVRRNW